MNQARRRAVLVVALAAVALVAAVVLWPEAPAQSELAPDVDAGVDAAPSPKPRIDRVRAATAPGADGGLPDMRGANPNVLASFGWGSGPGNLGRSRPDEANPEAPMSLTVDARGTTWILDQVNGRLVKVDRHGHPAGEVPLTLQAAQDVAIAKDGTAVVLDRLVDKSIALIGPDGQLKGELRVEGKGLEEGGAATGVFTHDGEVYVEREHGDLVHVGNTDGKNDPDRGEVPGRPSRDGRSYLSASIVDAAAGQVMLTAIERPSRAHRFTRQYGLGAPVVNLNLLDSDASGIIYLGSVVEAAGGTPEAPRFEVLVLCVDPVDGRPLGRTVLPPNEGAEETFRELAVPDEGGVLYLHRTEQGAQVLRASCP
jgi:hypothetical protein